MTRHEFSLEESQNHSEESQKSLDTDLNDNSIGHQRFKCHVCEGPDCLYPEICYNAVTVIRLTLLHIT